MINAHHAVIVGDLSLGTEDTTGRRRYEYGADARTRCMGEIVPILDDASTLAT